MVRAVEANLSHSPHIVVAQITERLQLWRISMERVLKFNPSDAAHNPLTMCCSVRSSPRTGQMSLQPIANACKEKKTARISVDVWREVADLADMKHGVSTERRKEGNKFSDENLST